MMSKSYDEQLQPSNTSEHLLPTERKTKKNNYWHGMYGKIKSRFRAIGEPQISLQWKKKVSDRSR